MRRRAKPRINKIINIDKKQINGEEYHEASNIDRVAKLCL